MPSPWSQEDHPQGGRRSVVDRGLSKVVSVAPSLAAVVCLLLLGCALPRDHEVPQRYLALGDSYTVGQGIAERERWPVQLAARLREHGVTMADPVVIAETGWTTGDLLAAIDAAQPRGPFALVSLLIGVNNQYQGRDLEQFRSELRTLLQRAVVFAEGDASRVLVLSIPDWGVTPFAAGYSRSRISTDIDCFNRVCREETLRIAAHYVDITPESRHAADDPTFLAIDGLHPSAKMYADWVELALPAALTAVGHGTLGGGLSNGAGQ